MPGSGNESNLVESDSVCSAEEVLGRLRSSHGSAPHVDVESWKDEELSTAICPQLYRAKSKRNCVDAFHHHSMVSRYDAALG
jgi:hypothetical protein